MRAAIPFALALIAGPVSAQVSIDSHGVRSGGTVIDASGVHTGTTSVDRTHRGGGNHATTILSNNLSRSVDCGGQSLTVNGNHNRLTIANCRSILVNGNDNLMSLTFAAPGRIALAGNHNQVGWQAARGIAVGVSNVGTGNRVSRR